MNKENGTSRNTAATRAEAAAWIARLRGPNRTPEVEDGLRRWLSDSPANAAAFERLTETWEKSARLWRHPVERLTGWDVAGFRISFSRAALALATCSAIAIITTVLYLHTDALTTDVGELRTVTLEDGTRVHLNTATRVRVRYDRTRREVALEQGEAFFEVAHRPDWPFIVKASGKQIRALGTQFVVRTDPQDLVVTLVQGKVDVSPADAPHNAMSDSVVSSTVPAAKVPAAALHETYTLAPGERLTLVEAQSPRIDWPAIDGVTAWERGQVTFENATLADAAGELNRYSRRRIVFADPATAAIHVSGVFATGDSSNFALAVSRAFNLKVEEESSQIVLAPQDSGTKAVPAR